YVSQLEQRLRRLLQAAKVKRMLDLDPSKIQIALSEMRTSRGLEGEGRLLSVSTRNEYITSIKGFSGWVTKRHRLEADPLACLEKAGEKDADKVHPRRALTVEEVTKLLDAAARRPEVERLTIR